MHNWLCVELGLCGAATRAEKPRQFLLSVVLHLRCLIVGLLHLGEISIERKLADALTDFTGSTVWAGTPPRIPSGPKPHEFMLAIIYTQGGTPWGFAGGKKRNGVRFRLLSERGLKYCLIAWPTLQVMGNDIWKEVVTAASCLGCVLFQAVVAASARVAWNNRTGLYVAKVRVCFHSRPLVKALCIHHLRALIRAPGRGRKEPGPYSLDIGTSDFHYIYPWPHTTAWVHHHDCITLASMPRAGA